MWKVQLFELNFDEEEIRAVQDVIRSGWITMGPKTIEFEQEFERRLGRGHCTAVSSGTAALHLALLALGVGPGDEVIVPALNFIAGANSIRLTGADPVLADCESYDNWNISLTDVRRKITDRTVAVMCVHYAGYPCRMDELASLCRDKGLSLIEDVAHAPGGEYRGQALGTWGDVGCFSFFTNKNLSVGEGGMAVALDAEVSSRIRYFRSHGMTTLTLDRHRGRALTYDVIQPGLNYRIDEMRAAMGLVQLEKLAEANRLRGELVARYHALLGDLDGVSIPFVGYEPGLNTYHIYPILLEEDMDRDAVVAGLKDHGIQASIHYPSVKGFSAYSGIGWQATPIADDVARRELTLPLFPTMTFEQIELVCSALEKVVASHRMVSRG